jgi:hypothetical protein
MQPLGSYGASASKILVGRAGLLAHDELIGRQRQLGDAARAARHQRLPALLLPAAQRPDVEPGSHASAERARVASSPAASFLVSSQGPTSGPSQS